MQTSNWMSFAVSFSVIIALLGALLFLLRRAQSRGLPGVPQRRIRILEAASVAPRQKLVLLRVKDQEILLGVSAQQITTLATFAADTDESTASAPKAAGSGDALGPLAQRMADRLKASTSSAAAARDMP
jgi:flagellar protein FliO/FliZ